jgi:hypothetical protein
MAAIEPVQLRTHFVFRAGADGVLKACWPFSTSCAAAFCTIAGLAIAAIIAAAARSVHFIQFFPFESAAAWVIRRVCTLPLKRA